jgi:RNA polymerase sigma-70 factor (ECF subfamily)
MEQEMKEREEKLLDAFLNGKESAFEELVEENRERLYKTVMRIVRNHDDALDVVQESLLKAYGGIAGFRRESGFSTWLTSIAVREAINRVKRDRFRTMISLPFLAAEPSATSHNPEVQAEVSLLERRVSEAIKSLPVVQRAVFTMKFYEGLKVREIAELVGSSEGSVKASYFHAMRKLRKSLRGLGPKG